ncbi:MAG: hypothetical protein H0W66_11050 [Chthoniobacterales bacterium]|nr:hypothetical protein [Chthoniobacterales bacterium]
MSKLQRPDEEFYFALEKVLDSYRRAGTPELVVQAVLNRAVSASQSIVTTSAGWVGVKRR